MNFLNSISSSPEQVIFYSVIALSVVVIILAILVIYLNQKIKRLLGGSSTAKNIEQNIHEIILQINDLKSFRSEIEKYLSLVEKRLRKSIQGVETIRFNPFKGTGEGGNQSFASAFINESGDGVVISSLHSRGGHVSIFSKQIKKYNCEFELTPEERDVLSKAKEDLKKS